MFTVVVIRGLKMIGVYLVKAPSEGEALKTFREESDRSKVLCARVFCRESDLLATAELVTQGNVTCVFTTEQPDRLPGAKR